MGYIYSKVCLNINKRQVVVNEDKYHEMIKRQDNIIKNGYDTSEIEVARISKSILEMEYNDYITKYVGTYSKDLRQIKIGEMLEDSFPYLIMYGLTNYDRPYLNIFNFSEHLDYLLAITFDIPLEEIQAKVLEMCYTKDITLECLSLVVTEGDASGQIGITVGELCDLHPKIKEFFNYVISNKLQSNIPMIDSVCNTVFSDFVEEVNPLDPTAAFRLKLFSSLVSTLQGLVTDFYDYKGKKKDIVYSQFISGVVFNTTEPIPEYTFRFKSYTQEFYLPFRVVKVR